MQEPAESIIPAQQNFDIDEGLNPVKNELEDDRIINIIKNTKTLDIHKNIKKQRTNIYYV